MKLRTSTGMVVVASVAACSAPAASPQRPAERAEEPARAERAEYKPGNDKPQTAPTPATPAPPGKWGPAGGRARALREAADLPEKAQPPLENGTRTLADQLFSTAELLTGPGAVALIAPRSREGAPPRVTTPTQKVDTAAPP